MAQIPSSFIIVGGSLGGLFAGVVLKRLGHNVRILERNPTPLLHHQGAGIVAGGHVKEFFDTYDTTRRQISVTSHVRQFLNRQGNVISKQRAAQSMTSWDLLYYLLRATFDGLESGYGLVPAKVDGDGSARYDYGHLVNEVDYTGNKIQLGFMDRDGKEGTVTADFVIAADGPSSSIRRIVLPDTQRRYVGYVAWRGTVLESELSSEAKDTFVEKFNFYNETGIQILCYLIPGENGTTSPGRRLLNWVWYCNYPEDSQAYAELMTDNNGAKHHTTLPAGKMRDEVWSEQKKYASEVLPPQFAEIVHKTRTPFVQSITDVLSNRALFFDNRLILLGDALAGFRPHTAASTSQAAFHALQLRQVLEGHMDWSAYERLVMRFANSVSAQGIALGNQSQFGHP